MTRRVVSAIAVFVVCLGTGLPVGDAWAQSKQIDLNGDGVAESRIVTKVLQSYPIKIQNVVYNEVTGRTFSFAWVSAAPGGFSSNLAAGPGVGTKHIWTTLQQVFSFTGSTCASDLCFQPSTGGTVGPFAAPGKSIFPTAVTTSGSILTSSVIVFFSPPQDQIRIDDIVLDGRIETTVSNPTGVDLELDIAEQDCCEFERMTICEDGCKFYLTDPDNCGGCGIQCGTFEVCVDGTCEPDCPEGLTLCGDECVDTDVDLRHCGGCDNACGDNDICDAGTCVECRPPEGTACPIPGLPFQAECVRIHQDPFNCGACGVRCDLLSCPSGGEGTCSQGNSCICSEAPSTDTYRVFGPPATDAVVEATVCAASQVEDLTVGAGQSETFCRFLPPTTLTEERVTVYNVSVGGANSVGTAIQRVPDLERPIGPVEIVYSGLFVDDGPTGDGVVQPGETFRLTIQLQNLGPQPLENIIGTLSAPATVVNPGCGITFSQASSPFPDLAGCSRTGTYDCDHPPPPCPEVENVTQFVGTVDATCTSEVFAIPMTLTLAATALVDDGTDGDLGLGPVTGIGVGESCDPATDLDGQTYDAVDGLASPVGAHLTLDPEFVNFSSSPVKKGSVPLKFQLYCGSRALRCQELDPVSRIVSLTHETLGPLPLTSINASNSNPADPFFGCNPRNQRQEFNLNLVGIPKGRIVIGIEMPDSREYYVGIVKQ